MTINDEQIKWGMSVVFGVFGVFKTLPICVAFSNETGLSGPDRFRTDDLLHAMQARSQLRYRPTQLCRTPHDRMLLTERQAAKSGNGSRPYRDKSKVPAEQVNLSLIV